MYIDYRMRLDPHECTQYYCHQIGHGQYFQGVPYQRGYGLFGDIVRYITPFVSKAGRYLGKHLLSTGTKVISDVAVGKKFKQSAAERLKESGVKIKDELLSKLQHGSGIKRKSRSKFNIPKPKRKKVKTRRKRRDDVFSRS